MAENNYVDHVRKNGVDYEIHDARGGGGNHPTVYEVESINLSEDLLSELRPGDVVIISYPDSPHSFIVSQKGQSYDVSYVYLVNYDGWNTIEIAYRSNNDWQPEVNDLLTPHLYDADEIEFVDSDIIENLNVGDVIKNPLGSGDYAYVCYAIRNVDDEAGAGVYLYSFSDSDKILSVCRYVWDDDANDGDGAYVFDTTYGDDGWVRFNLGGGSGGTRLYSHMIEALYSGSNATIQIISANPTSYGEEVPVKDIFTNVCNDLSVVNCYITIEGKEGSNKPHKFTPMSFRTDDYYDGGGIYFLYYYIGLDDGDPNFDEPYINNNENPSCTDVVTPLEEVY